MNFKVGDRVKIKPFEKINSSNKNELGYLGISKKIYKENLENKQYVIALISGGGDGDSCFIDLKSCIYILDIGCIQKQYINITDDMFKI